MSIPAPITRRVFRYLHQTDSGSAYEEILNAEPVEIPPVRDLHIYAGSDPDDGDFWEIIDGFSGFSVHVSPTRDWAIEGATQRIGRMGAAAYSRNLKRLIRMIGVSPRYDRRKLQNLGRIECWHGDGHSIEDRVNRTEESD